jgi:hypothetical protein
MGCAKMLSEFKGLPIETCHALPYANENGGPIAGTTVNDDTI